MLNVLNRRCLRDILGVSWKDQMTNEELLQKAGVGDMAGYICRGYARDGCQWQWHS